MGTGTGTIVRVLRRIRPLSCSFGASQEFMEGCRTILTLSGAIGRVEAQNSFIVDDSVGCGGIKAHAFFLPVRRL